MSQNNTIDGQCRLQGVSATVVFTSYKLKCKEKPVPIDGITPCMEVDLHSAFQFCTLPKASTVKAPHNLHCPPCIVLPCVSLRNCLLLCHCTYEHSITPTGPTLCGAHTLGVYVHLYSFLHTAEIHPIQV